MLKVKIAIVLVVLAVAGIVLGLWKAGWLKSYERVSVIEETPNIVEAVEQIQELCTEYYYDEVMVRDSVVKTGASAAVANTVNSAVETAGNWFSNLFSKDEEKAETKQSSTPVVSKLEKDLVVIVKVTCRVGYDLREIVEDNGMQVCGDTLFIDLPKPKFLETIANPTDISIFVEDGNWKFPEELQGAIRHAKGIVEQRAMADSILEKADVSGRKILNSLFSTMGFKVFFTDDMPEGIQFDARHAEPSQEEDDYDEDDKDESLTIPAQEVPAA